MKKLFTLLLLVTIQLLTFAQDKVNVVASASIFRDMAEQVGGEYVNTQSIVPIGADPHTYTPKPSDAKLVTEADLILINGLTFEGWINELIENSGTKAKVVLITEGVRPITSLVYDNASDPHAWMDALNGVVYVQNIASALATVDPKHSAEYIKNAEAYKKEIKQADAYIKKQIQSIPADKRVLITSHDAFQYFGRAYGIELNAIQGISTEAEARAKDVQRVIQTIRQKNVPAIFIESTINPKLLKQISDDTGAQIGGELFADSLGEEDGPGGTYIKMLTHNAEVITNALTGSKVEKTKIDTDDTSSNWLVYALLGGVMLLSLLLFMWKMNK